MGKKKINFRFEDTFQTEIKTDRVKKGEITLDSFIEIHKIFIDDKELEGLSSRTIKEHILYLNHFVRYVKENIRLDLDRVVVESQLFKGYIYFMLHEKNYSPTTVNVRLRPIKCYLKWLYDNERIKENISIKLKLVKTPQDTIKPLTDNEVKKILKTCDLTSYAGYRDFTAIILILDTGIRVGELCETKISDVDLKQQLLIVRATVAKTRISRHLPLSPKTCKLLRELIECSIDNETEYIFQSTYGGKIQKENLMLSFRRLGERAKMSKRCSPYVFRHTFATNSVKKGIMDLFTLQRIMGHSSLITTRRYIQLETEDLKRNHKKASPIDQYFE